MIPVYIPDNCIINADKLTMQLAGIHSTIYFATHNRSRGNYIEVVLSKCDPQNTPLHFSLHTNERYCDRLTQVIYGVSGFPESAGRSFDWLFLQQCNYTTKVHEYRKIQYTLTHIEVGYVSRQPCLHIGKVLAQLESTDITVNNIRPL